MKGRQNGFTLIEVLVALELLSIAFVVIAQLFSANLRNISTASAYASAAAKAEARMREILDSDTMQETNISETARDGSGIDITIREVMQDKTGTLGVGVYDVYLTSRWPQGKSSKSFTLRTRKLAKKEVRIEPL